MPNKGDKQMHLRQYISDRLENKRLSRQEFAEALGRDKSTISNWLNGKYDIPIDAIEAIADVLEEKTPIRLYRMAGLFANQPIAALIEALDGETPENIRLVERVARALLQKENH
jgi:transcriptional regulator with XRE-family HTH domain